MNTYPSKIIALITIFLGLAGCHKASESIPVDAPRFVVGTPLPGGKYKISVWVSGTVPDYFTIFKPQRHIPPGEQRHIVTVEVFLDGVSVGKETKPWKGSNDWPVIPFGAFIVDEGHHVVKVKAHVTLGETGLKGGEFMDPLTFTILDQNVTSDHNLPIHITFSHTQPKVDFSQIPICMLGSGTCFCFGGKAPGYLDIDDIVLATFGPPTGMESCQNAVMGNLLAGNEEAIYCNLACQDKGWAAGMTPPSGVSHPVPVTSVSASCDECPNSGNPPPGGPINPDPPAPPPPGAPVPLPTTNGIVPSATTPNSPVIVSGSNFVNPNTGMSQVTGVAVAGLLLHPTAVNVQPTGISILLPPNVQSGPITIFFQGGFTLTTSMSLAILSNPSIQAPQPAASHGDSLSLQVNGYSPEFTTGVSFPGPNGTRIDAEFEVSASGELQVTVPMGAVSGEIRIDVRGWEYVVSPAFTLEVVPLPSPAVLSFSPDSAAQGSSTYIQINGENFLPPVSVEFNGQLASDIHHVSLSLIEARLPSIATSGRIRVTAAGGSALSATSFFVLPPAPTISGFSPLSGRESDSIQISGNHFENSSEVFFNGTKSLSVQRLSSTLLLATVPIGATSGPIRVTNSGGFVLSNGEFQVLSPIPTLTSAPASARRGDTITLSGSGFLAPVLVTIANIQMTLLEHTSESVTFRIPEYAVSGILSLSALGGSVSTNFSVEILPPPFPVIGGYSPNAGFSGETLTIIGENLTSTNQVLFGNQFAAFNVVSDTEVRAVIPALPPSPTALVQVQTAHGTVSAPNAFVFLLPNVVSITPTASPVGAEVTIIGANLAANNQLPEVRFNGTRSLSVTKLSAVSIRAIVPAGATNGPVSVNNGTGSSSSAEIFTIMARPTVSGFSPQSGIVGTRVSISGDGLSHVNEVKFNGRTAVLESSGGTSIVAIVPLGATTGKIEVSSPAGSAQSEADFLVHAKRILVGTGPGTQAKARSLSQTGAEAWSQDTLPYGQFSGGVRVAHCDTNQDGIPEVYTAAGSNGGPHIRAFDGRTGEEIQSFFAYHPDFKGGVYLAAADINGDGRCDIITGAGENGGPHVRVFSGADRSILREFMAYNPAFTGGVRVAAADVNNDGHVDIITAAGPGGGPHVRFFSGLDGTDLGGFMAYNPAFTGGVFVAAGDVTGDGQVEIITGADAGGGPHVRVFSPDGRETAGKMAYDPSFTGGARIAVVDLDNDGTKEIITGSGPGMAPSVRAFNLRNRADGTKRLELRFEILPSFTPNFTGGVYVGG